MKNYIAPLQEKLMKFDDRIEWFSDAYGTQSEPFDLFVPVLSTQITCSGQIGGPKRYSIDLLHVHAEA